MGWFSDQFNNAAGAFFGSDYLRDYKHASKTFRSNGYAYSPKFKFLFHVYFNINQEAYTKNTLRNENFGLAVKTVKLPSYSFQISENNQYNRKRLTYTKVKYDPIDITFHDDNNNLINGLWVNYFTYYFRDASKPNVVFSGARGTPQPTTQSIANGQGNNTLADYNFRNTYSDNLVNNDWGYIGEANAPTSTGNPTPQKVPFFKDITIFGFNQHNFTAYTLINPIITRFAHDTYSYGENAGIMENSMALDYETVVYNQGSLDGGKPENYIPGFGDEATYDRLLSPIAKPGSNRTIMGQGGLVDGVGGTIRSLAEGDILGAVRNAGTTYNSFKGQNLKQIAKAEATTGLINSIQGTPNRNQLFNTPIFGATPSGQGTAGAPSGASQSPPAIGPNQTAGQTAGQATRGQ
jgi:hypothetical protein